MGTIIYKFSVADYESLVEIDTYLFTDLLEDLLQRLFSAILKETIAISIIELCKMGLSFIRCEPHVMRQQSNVVASILKCNKQL